MNKIYQAPLNLKSGDKEGQFIAVFAPFNVIDHHGDVTLPGAFTDGQQAIIEAWNHDYSLPVGAGVVRSDSEKAWIEGEFFIDTTNGRDHYATVKNLAARGMGEWSYSFNILDSEPGTQDGMGVRLLKRLDVAGVGPVTRGAGIGTHTVAIKSKQDKGEDEASHGKSRVTSMLLELDIIKAKSEVKKIS